MMTGEEIGLQWADVQWSKFHDQALAEFRSKGCWVCGISEKLTAHHIQGSSKLFNIGAAMVSSIGITAFQEELDKCACVCRTCHDKIHARREQ
jgi:3'-phosphoadenosine 5'-phosphosulfate sulfotransferase (PAPS reductase)/FAD synthetase